MPLLALQFFPQQQLGGYGGVDGSEFVFARLIYSEGFANFRGFGRRGNWAVDWPKADKQFIFAIDRLSNVRVVLDQECYPNRFSGYAFRMGINWIVYSMTH